METVDTDFTVEVNAALTQALWPPSKVTGTMLQIGVSFTTAWTATFVDTVAVDMFLTLTTTMAPLTL